MTDVILHSRDGIPPELIEKSLPPKNRGRRESRVPIAPAASYAKLKSIRASHHRFAGTPGLPCAMVLTASFVLAPVTGYRMHTSLLRKLPETDSLLGVGFTEGGVMSMELGLGRFGDRRLEKGGPLYTRRWFDGLVRASDASQGTGHGRFGSRVFCATTG